MSTVRSALLRRARLAERVWVGLALLWSCVRIWFVRHSLARYGVNPWLYAAVELGSTVPYAVGVSRTVLAFTERRLDAATRWGALATVCFLLPELAVVLDAHQLPLWVYLLMGSVLVAGGSWAVIDVRRRVMVARVQRPL